MIFVAVWTILVVLYTALTPKVMPKLSHVFAILALDALTMLFWFAAFIALAVYHHQIENSVIEVGDIFGDVAAVFGAFEWYVCQCRCALATSTSVLLLL